MPENSFLLQQILVWVHCTKRPLTIWELQHAVAVRPNSRELKLVDIPDPARLQTVSKGLLEVNSVGDIYPVGDRSLRYLVNSLGNWLENTDTEIARVCLTYMRFNVFEYSPPRSDGEFEVKLQANAFYEYAACYWGYHVRRAAIRARRALRSQQSTDPDIANLNGFNLEAYRILIREVYDFLKNEACLVAAVQALKAAGPYRSKMVAIHRVMVADRPIFTDYSQKVPQKMTGLHVAGYFGLLDVIPALVESEQDPNARNSFGQTPLSLAAAYGHSDVVACLASRYRVNPSSKCDLGFTPLNYAACNGHVGVVQLLLDVYKVDVESPSAVGRSALSGAAMTGNYEVARVLVDRGANVNSFEGVGYHTPLIFAVFANSEKIVRLLVEKGAIINQADKSGQTALGHAADLGFEAIAIFLYQTSIKPAATLFGQTPLSNSGRVLMKRIAQAEQNAW